MESVSANQELVSVDFSVVLKNIQGFDSEASVPFQMAIDGGEPELVHIIMGFDPGEEASFVFARELTPGSHTVTFFIGDIVIDSTSIDIEPAGVSLLPSPTPTNTPTPEPTSTPTPTNTPTPEPTETPTPTATQTAVAAPSTPPTATSLPTTTATPPPKPTVVATPSPMPTATASPTTKVATFSLQAFTNGSWLEQQDPQLASSIKELDWIKDGIDDTESKAIQDLLYIAVTSRSVVASIVSLSWVQDGIHDVEAGAFRWLNNIGSAEVASSVVSLGWVEDGIDAVEVEALENLSYIANKDTGVGLSIITLGWIQDGIADLEAGAIDWLKNIASAEVALSVVSLGWVEDGIDAVEVEALENLSYMSNKDTGVGLSLTSLSWVQDGIGSLEARAIEEVSYLSHEHTAAALFVVGMPFMETIEPPDISAVASLWQLAADDLGSFETVMSHGALQDGISDDLAPVVATLHGVAETNPGLIDVLLDPSRVLLERRTITLPLAGDVVLDIIRTASGAASSMDLLEHSVRRIEEYMDAPFPTRYVSILYENAVGAGGKNFGTHIAILPEADVDDENELDRTVIAHEVAHYYWSGNKNWVDEGGANFLEIERHFMGASRDAAASVSDPPCGYASNIAELEDLDEGIESVCEYSLGERLFVDLYLTLGDERFREGFRTLYLSLESESVGIDQVREAFRSDDGAASAVISRWWDGTGSYDLSRLDTSPVNPGLISISGRIDEAYIATGTDGPAVSDFSVQDVTDWVYLTLKFSYDVTGGPHKVPLEIVEYYEDGFEFSRRSGELAAQAKSIGGTAWFSVGTHPSRKWAPGRYWVYVYAGERKVAEVQYEVTP